MDQIATAVDPFVFRFSIFVLAVFVGYYVVWSVPNSASRSMRALTRRGYVPNIQRAAWIG